MKNLTNWFSIIFLGTAAVIWPFWLVNGYLEDWYPLIGSFVAIYGGLIANIVYLIKTKKGK
jgi:hypothetical protein